MYPNRESCPVRHENGNCLSVGGFCSAVPDPVCEAVHNAYDSGYRDGAKTAKSLMTALSGETSDLEEDRGRIKTYADRIRSKSDAELAQLLFYVSHNMRRPLNQEQVLVRLQEEIV